MQWELGQIQAAGPTWKEQMVAGNLAGEGEAVVGGEGGGVAGGGGGAVPEFGGGPAAEGETPEAEAPEAVDPIDEV